MQARVLVSFAFVGLVACDGASPTATPGVDEVPPTASQAAREPAQQHQAALELTPPPPLEPWVDKLPDAPKGLHHLIVGEGKAGVSAPLGPSVVEICALDEEGTLWCYYDPDYFGDFVGGWLQPRPFAPKLRSLHVGAAGSWCGQTLDGQTVCAPYDAQMRYRKLADESDARFDALSSGYAKDGGDWHYLHSIHLHVPDIEPAPFLDGYQALFSSPNAFGTVAVGGRDSVVFELDHLRDLRIDALEAAHKYSSIPLPSLDGQDVIAADISGGAMGEALSGCAVTGAGAVLCWDEQGEPSARRHAADGQGFGIAVDRRPSYRGALCVLTEAGAVCDWATDEGAQTPYMLPFVAPRELASYRGTLCALDAGPGIRCLSDGVSEPNLSRVHGLPEVRRLVYPTNNYDQGWCALTEAGGLWCWGDPFELRARPGGVEVEGPYAGPSELIAAGVVDFQIGSEGQAWCLTTADGTRCEGESWSKPRSFSVGVEIAWVDAQAVCSLEAGQVSCEGIGAPLSSSLTKAVTGVTVDAFWASPKFGCLAAGKRVRCWDAEEDQLFELSAPAKVRALQTDEHGACAWLEGGEVTCWRRAQKGDRFVSFQDELRLDSFDASDDGYCGSTQEGLTCCTVLGSVEYGKRWGRELAGVRGGMLEESHRPRSGCVLDEAGSVYCVGQNVRGQLGLAGDQAVALPLREGQAIGALERELGI